jgi:hypothetical protein
MRNNLLIHFLPPGLSILLILSLVSACNMPTDRKDPAAEYRNAIAHRLKLLEDREEIRELIMNYGRFLDRRNFADFSDLFAEKDGEWIGGMGKAKGSQAIRKLMEDKIGGNSGNYNPSNFHLFTNDRIDVAGDNAEASTKWLFVVQNASNQPQLFYLGHYEDRFVRENGRWKILRRTVYSDIPQDNPTGIE